MLHIDNLCEFIRLIINNEELEISESILFMDDSNSPSFGVNKYISFKE